MRRGIGFYHAAALKSQSDHAYSLRILTRAFMPMACKPTREGLSAAIFWLRVRAGWSESGPRGEEPLGKKESAERDALTAGDGTEWGQLVTGVLLDELHEIAKVAAAERIIGHPLLHPRILGSRYRPHDV